MKRSLLTLSTILLAVCMIFTACSSGTDSSSDTTSEASKPVSSASDISSNASEPAESTDNSGSETNPEKPIRVLALKGPTAMGMIHLMDNPNFEFTLVAAPDEATALIAQGEVDIAAIPANLASVLYNKTEGKIQTFSINTLGVLYIVENGETVSSIEDLRGKTIFASGQGATPEYALRYMLSENGIDPDNDVTIEFKAEHAECVTAITTTENSVAMLPQPFVTTAMSKSENIKIVLDITEEWEKLSEANNSNAALLTGVTVVQKAFAAENPELVEYFIAEHEKSVQAVNSNPEEASTLIEAQDIIPAAVAVKAIPECNIVNITGADMKAKLSAYLETLVDQNPQAVGGSLPDDEFYYQGK